ncbi:hypothetical protein [Pseudochelatococcus sp. G4_1912]|uniref:hypothetical protein n=1 Tax=Pseudochelatococcus sp. G4_1912 TaxID=3114288 RepID=UPI0039C6A61D
MSKKDMMKKDNTKSLKKTEDLLDESLEESFPASDPPTLTRAPADKRETKYPPPKKDGKPKHKSAGDYSI